MNYRVYLPNDGEPHEEGLRALLDCPTPTFVRVDGDLVVWDYQIDEHEDEIPAEVWLNAHEAVIGWERLP